MIQAAKAQKKSLRQTVALLPAWLPLEQIAWFNTS